ncbi:MAG: azurin [Pigmentiphaga sp.]
MSRPVATIAVLAALVLPGVAAAQNCEITVNSNDAMQYDVKEIVVDKSCPSYTVTLKHTGKLPVNAMGHNWVLTTASDFEATGRDAIAAGPGNGYLKPNDKRVIAHTDMIGGGQETQVSFDPKVLQDGTEYVFFCSFPGHSTLMKGKLTLGG